MSEHKLTGITNLFRTADERNAYVEGYNEGFDNGIMVIKSLISDLEKEMENNYD